MTAFAQNLVNTDGNGIMDQVLGLDKLEGLDGVIDGLVHALDGINPNAQEADRGLLGGLGLAAAEFTKENEREQNLLA